MNSLAIWVDEITTGDGSLSVKFLATQYFTTWLTFYKTVATFLTIFVTTFPSYLPDPAHLRYKLSRPMLSAESKFLLKLPCLLKDWQQPRLKWLKTRAKAVQGEADRQK